MEKKKTEEIYKKNRWGNDKKECLAISGSLELRTEVGKQSVEVANPQTSKSWNQSVHERTSAASCEFACVMHIVHLHLHTCKVYGRNQSTKGLISCDVYFKTHTKGCYKLTGYCLSI